LSCVDVPVFGCVADVTVSALPAARENAGMVRMTASMVRIDIIFLNMIVIAFRFFCLVKYPH